MTEIRSFIVSVVAAAMICAIVKRICPEKGAIASLIAMVCGLLMAVTVLRPILTADISDRWPDIGEFSLEAQQVAAAGKEEADAALRAHIKEKTQAYILQEAAKLQVDITVEIQLSADTIPRPEGITVSGAVSPYAKARLAYWIAEELGIPKEAQVWID